MSQESQDKEPVEETDEGTLIVADPEEYQKTKKLESIHKARERVRDVRSYDPGTASKGEWEAHYARLARAVADYASEMMVLIDKGVQNGTFEESVYQVDTPKGELDIRRFVVFDGADVTEMESDQKSPAPMRPGISMAIYRHLDRILHELGLGLDFDEDKGPAQI